MDVTQFQGITAALMEKHYGIGMQETTLGQRKVCESVLRAGVRPYEAVNAYVSDQGIFRTDIRGKYGLPSKEPLSRADEQRAIELETSRASIKQSLVATEVREEQYAGSIIAGHEDQYDALEIHGVRNRYAENDPRGTNFEIDEANPEMYSVYAHLKEGGVDAVGDFGRYERAKQYASRLSADYAWPIHDSVVSSARRASA